jgi:predicted ATPase
VNQLRFGARLIPSQEEKNRLAAFVLQAGRNSVGTSNFLMASQNLTLGIELLDRRSCWRDEYDLSLALFYTAAEVEFCIGNFSRMNERIDVLISHVRHPEDRVRALTLRVSALGAQGHSQQALELGIKTLREVGESFPRQPGILRLLVAFGKVKSTLSHFSDDDILNLPVMTDPCLSVAMTLMKILFPFSLYVQQKLAPFFIFRIVQRTLSNGMTAVSSAGFSSFAMLAASGFGQIEMGTRYGNVALKLLERSNSKEWLPRVYSAVYGFVFPWKGELDAQMKPLLTAYRIGLASGDMEFAIMSACFHVAMATHISLPLEETMSAGEGYMEVIQDHKQAGMVNFIYPSLHFVANMLCGDGPLEPASRMWYLNTDNVPHNLLDDRNATTTGKVNYRIEDVTLFILVI